MYKIIIILLLTFLKNYSQNSNIKSRFLITGALEFGGDELGYVLFDDGSTQSINSGQGGTISIGGELELLKIKGLFFRGTLGYKYVTTKATNKNIDLTRIPIELSLNYNIVNKFWIGSGLLKHYNIKLDFDGLTENEQYTSNLGVILKIGYGGLGISYTLMNYKGRYQETYNANSFGIFFSIPLYDKNWKK